MPGEIYWLTKNGNNGFHLIHGRYATASMQWLLTRGDLAKLRIGKSLTYLMVIVKAMQFLMRIKAA